MSFSTMVFWAAILAATGVALGAYSAHGLEGLLVSAGYQEDLQVRMQWFDTGVRYQMIHAIGLFLVAILSRQVPQMLSGAVSASAFLAGCMLFSGSLYVMTLASPAWKKLGAVVPFGGLSFIIGWVAIAVAAWRFAD